MIFFGFVRADGTLYQQTWVADKKGVPTCLRGAFNGVVYHSGLLAVLIGFFICSWSGRGRAVKLILCGCTADIVKQLCNLKLGSSFFFCGQFLDRFARGCSSASSAERATFRTIAAETSG